MTTKKPTTKKQTKKKSPVKKQPVKKKTKSKAKPKKKSKGRKNAVGGAGGLTTKQMLFVNYYIGEAEFNAAEATRLAGYSKDTAGAIGHENLNKPEIALAIIKAIEKRAKNVETSAEWVLKRLEKQAVADLSDLYNEAGGIKPIHEWPLVWRQGLVAGIESKEEFEFIDGQKVSAGFIVKVKLSERIKRDELIGKHHAMFTDNVNLGGDMILRAMTDLELDEKIAKMKKKK